MKIIKTQLKSDAILLALGAESAGNFSVFENGQIHFSEDFGDLLDEANFSKFQTAVLKFLKNNNIKPGIILTDLHPNYKTTLLGKNLAKKFKAKHVQVQHHLAHVFSQIGNELISRPKTHSPKPKTYYGIALDGTGYGTDGKIWGGEVFGLKLSGSRFQVERIGKLEDQIMIGSELAVREPARMLISILDKFLEKKAIYPHLKKFYSHNEFELLYNQLQSGFNCIETSSTGRILDAVSILLGFAKNERSFKHEATYLLEKSSTKPHLDLKPKLIEKHNKELGIRNWELDTTFLFQYLIKNINKNKKKLAATAQLYIAQGLAEIIKKNHESRIMNQEKKSELQIILSGGIGNNKIISDYFKLRDKKISDIPRGDAGLSFGQIIFQILN